MPKLILRLLFFIPSLFASTARSNDCTISIVSGGQNTYDSLSKKLKFYEEVAGCKLEMKRYAADLVAKNFALGHADIIFAPSIKSVVKLAGDLGAKLVEEDCEETVINQIPIQAVMSPDRMISNLKPEHVEGILSGSIKNWKDIGGRDEPLRLYLAKDKVNVNTILSQTFLKGEKPVAEFAVDHLGLIRAIRASSNVIAFMSEKNISVDGYTPKYIDSGANITIKIIKRKKASSNVTKFFEHFKTKGPIID